MAKVLMVDDSPLLLKIARSHLEKGGHTVIEARDGREAVDKARVERPDIIFLDAEMPEMDGWEACETLKKDPGTAAIPIYMYTGHDLGGEEEERFKAVGANGYLQKPYKPDEMYNVIKAIKN
jgi:CheY-like chemotaxis protein